ncbi:MAG: nucleotidyltransferase family protein [Gammaproteobacteria bacterium]|nr:nucleotidyltransferase family protein [Gammaproteobacteria bacterium]MBT8150764.1 nucleotidyltransferase family protein [Gammaproteobacteria bacterium]NNL11489.1 nucleotidyltransferase family protein [Pseudomonadales bacterium]NNM10500.1 nucleotidyltransferase family protein [Pseudomonadales bacterium]RZV49643.1 MAG: nucleotidyltransferase family protein [Pseudomonadales bacterium]
MSKADSKHAGLVAVMLAAGTSSRFGGCKLSATIHGKSILEHSLSPLQQVFGQQCLVVLGAHASQLRPLLGSTPSTYCEDYRQGMGHSLACGVREATRRFAPKAILLVLADQVALSADDYRALLKASANGERLCCAAYPPAEAGQHRAPLLGVPAVFPASYSRQLMSLQGDRGARHLLSVASPAAKTVALPNAAIDIDTPAALQRYLLTR